MSKGRISLFRASLQVTVAILLVLSGFSFTPATHAAASALQPDSPQGPTAPTATTVFINEFHYDNTGTDTQEGIEIAGPAGTNVAGWTIVLYNGNTAAAAVTYGTISMTGTIPDQQSGYGTLFFGLPANGIQNGPSDGFALVDPSNTVIQLLSYAGVFTASNGPAAGMTSVDIGIVEPSTTPVGFSLQLTGSGLNYEDFTWTGPIAKTYTWGNPVGTGAVNTGQTFSGSPVGDLTVAKTGPARIIAGDDIVYGITVANTAIPEATGVLITDTLPAGVTYVADNSGLPLDDSTPGVLVWDAGSILENQSVSFIITATTDAGIVNGTVLSNLVEIYTSTDGENAANNSATRSTIAHQVVPISVARNGINGQVFAIEGQVTVPPGVYSAPEWELQDASGGIAAYNVTSTPLALGDYVRVFATRGAYQNQEQMVTPVYGFKHLGPGPLVDPLPYTTGEVASGVTEGWLVTVAGEVSAFNTADCGQAGDFQFNLNDGSGATIIYVDGDAGINLCATVANGTLLRLTGFSSQFGANYQIKPRFTSDIKVIVEGLMVSKAGPGLAAPGETFAYTLTVENNLGPDLEGVVVVDTLPANVSYVSGGTEADGVVTWAVGDLAEGESIDLTLEVMVEAEEGETILNSDYAATATNQPDPVTGPPVTTFVAPALRIHHLQGVEDTSPFAGKSVTDIRGIVTAFHYNSSNLQDGFFMQEPQPDNNPLTSEGIFVYSNSAVAIGNVALVSGKVTEYKGLTEINNVISVSSVPTTTVITATPVDLPVDEGLTLEPYESMLVVFPEDLSVSQNYFQARYGQVILSAEGRMYNPTNGNGLGDTFEYNARRMLTLDDGTDKQNMLPTPYLEAGGTLRAGDTVSGLTGVLDHGPVNDQSVNNFRLHPTEEVAFTHVNERPLAPEFTDGNVTVASFNVLNYFNSNGNPASPWITGRGANSWAEFHRQRTKIITALLEIDADVVGLMEIENDAPGLYPTALEDLVNGLNELSTEPYAFVVEPAPGTDEIKVALIYKPGVVTPVGPAANYQGSEGIYNPLYDRPPLAQTFSLNENGEVFSVIVNHFKSKGCGSASGADADQGDGQGCWNAKRTAQANGMLDIIAEIQTQTGDGDVLVIGDLNAYGIEDPINVLTTELIDQPALRIPGAERYSYVFDGFSGYLDHALSTGSLDPQVVDVAYWHINADEPSALDYNVEFNDPALYAPDAYRASDHDPVIISLKLEHSVQFSTADYSVDEDGGSATITVTLNTPAAWEIEVEVDTIVGGSASADEDYTPVTGQVLIFPVGETEATFTVDILDDSIYEGDETILLELSNPVDVVLGDLAAATLTILDDESNPTVQFSSATYSVDESETTASLVATLSHPAAYEIEVEVATVAGGSATPAEDYVSIIGHIMTFPAGETEATFTVDILDDAIYEDDETVLLELSNPAGVDLGDLTVATLTILDDDAAPTMQFGAPTYSVEEGEIMATITVILTGETEVEAQVDYATVTGGTATPDEDYEPVNGTLTFAPGELIQTFDIPITDDLFNEPDETVLLELSGFVDAQAGDPIAAVLTILDDDIYPAVAFSASTYTVDEDALTATITVTLSAEAELETQVDYATLSGGTATPVEDYEPVTGTLIFEVGDLSQTFTIQITDDLLAEIDETILLELSNPEFAILGDPVTATLTILDNDAAPTVEFSAAAYSVDEGSLATITVTLSAAYELPVTVDFATMDLTATAGSDYTPITGTLTFAPGETTQTFTVTVLDDDLEEADEGIKLTLSNPVNALLGTLDEAVLTILDDDEPIVPVEYKLYLPLLKR